MRHATLAMLALASLLAACMGNPAPEDVEGRYAYINWGKSHKACNNDVCTYGNNQETLKSQVRCHERTDLSWHLVNWVHGSMTVVVEDPTGEQKHRRTLSVNGRGNITLVGERGAWHLEGVTNNANGNLQVRLTCL